MSKRGVEKPEEFGGTIYSYLRDLDREKGSLKLVPLWKAWTEIFGPEMAEMLRPLGHRKGVLKIGCSDSVVMQEMNFFQGHILEKVNSFLQEEYFDKIRFELLNNSTPLDEIKPRPDVRRHAPPRPVNLGGLQGRLSPDSPVTRCYEKYVAFLKGQKR